MNLTLNLRHGLRLSNSKLEVPFTPVIQTLKLQHQPTLAQEDHKAHFMMTQAKISQNLKRSLKDKERDLRTSVDPLLNKKTLLTLTTMAVSK